MKERSLYISNARQITRDSRVHELAQLGCVVCGILCQRCAYKLWYILSLTHQLSVKEWII
jgi:hypothetical protein